MKHIKAIWLFLFAVLVLSVQGVKAQQNTYNYTHAVQALQEGDIANGQAYLFKELAINPKNGYAWSMLSASYAIETNVDSALIAIDNAIRYLPKTDEQTLVKCYNAKTKYLSAINEDGKILETINEAIKRLPNNSDLYALRGDYYTNHEQYDLARKDFKKLLDIDKGSVDGMILIGHAFLNEDKYTEGLEWYDKALAADASNDDARMGRVLALLAMEKTEPALDDLLTLHKSGNETSGNLLVALTDSIETREIVLTKTKARQAAEPAEGIWPYTLGGLYAQIKQRDESIKYYKLAFEIYKDAETAEKIGRQYFAVNQYKEAEEWADKAVALAKDSDLLVGDYYEFKGDILKDQGDYDGAIRQYSETLKEDDDRANAYFQRALCHIYQGKNEEALPDLDAAVSHGENGVAVAYAWRGWIYKMSGKTMEAQGDFRNAVEKDSVGTPIMPTFMGQHFLGIDNMAKESAARCLKENGEPDDYLCVACLYALMDDKPMAVRHLELAIEKGFNSWYVLRDHPWLKSLKGYADYEALLKKYLK